MERKKALELLKQNVSSQNLVKHCLAVEALMRALASYFKEDEEKWGLVGLLHDIDYEKTKDSPEQHSLIGAQMLKDYGLDEESCWAVRAHNEAHGLAFESLMAKALFVSDPLTGLIVASALVLPSKKIAEVTAENVLNRFKENSFARGANRATIKRCQELLGLEIQAFVSLGLKAMQGISQELGL